MDSKTGVKFGRHGLRDIQQRRVKSLPKQKQVSCLEDKLLGRKAHEIDKPMNRRRFCRNLFERDNWV